MLGSVATAKVITYIWVSSLPLVLGALQIYVLKALIDKIVAHFKKGKTKIKVNGKEI